jgi:hypothetical protein
LIDAVVIVFVGINVVALMALPRRWAALPLLVGACYMTLGQAVEIGPFSFTVLRLLILVGIGRVVVRGERPSGGYNKIDRMMLIWAAWAVISSAFHEPADAALVNRLGLVYDTLGIYLLFRSFCHTPDEIAQLIKCTACLLVPVALEMIYERFTGRNLFALFGGISEVIEVRGGKLRAQGPFGHSILAGNVGGVCVPLMIAIWRKEPLAAKAGLIACLGIVFASSSSGPILTTMAALFGLLLWRWRHHTRKMRVAAVALYVLLDLFMKVPAYYIIGRIDLTGNSTGWHRARLIESSIEHLDEWWFSGTDYTRHWMPTGVPWNPNHTDITNHYLHMGVLGGLPLMLLFIGTFWLAFKSIGLALRSPGQLQTFDQFMFWALGAALFAEATSFVSVSIFDQSFIFLYMIFAMISAVRADGSAQVRISN